tara:strand:+ start:711 stop:842 length:132 start_codon:yes stop_codon:yes gene_type:complete
MPPPIITKSIPEIIFAPLNMASKIARIASRGQEAHKKNKRKVA